MAHAPTVCAKPGCPDDAIRRGLCRAHQRRSWANRSPSSLALSGNVEHRRERRLALARSGGHCERCDRKYPRRLWRLLQLHHPHQISDGGDIVQADAELLCPDCHRQADKEAAR